MTSGAWCELQHYYTLTLLPGGRKAPTDQMTAGTKVHKALEDEVHKTIHVDVATREDAMGVRMWNLIQGLQTLANTGLTREVQVWGILDGQVVSGVIDGLGWENPDAENGAADEDGQTTEDERNSMPSPTEKKRRSRRRRKAGDNTPPETSPQATMDTVPDQKTVTGRMVYLTDVKTRGSMTIPSPAAIIPAKIQLNLYYRFIGDMITDNLDFVKIFRRYGADPDELFSDEFLTQLADMHDEMAEPESTPTPTAEQQSQQSQHQHSQQYQQLQESQQSSSSISSSISSSSSSSPSSSSYRYRTLRELIPLVKESITAAFPQGTASVSPRLCIEYRHRQGGHVVKRVTFDADPEMLSKYVRDDLEWWRGERAPRGVSMEDTFKCRTCDFAENCQWRHDLDMERLMMARERLIQRRMAQDERADAAV